MNDEIEIAGPTIGLGQLLKFAGVADSGAHARALIAEGDVQVDGAVETRRGAQIAGGAVVRVALPGGTETLRVTSREGLS